MMSDSPGRTLSQILGSLVDGLWAGGVTRAVVCPGSRSTPLAILLDRHPSIELLMHYDERSAAYFALGLAKWSQAPVALLTTSGTAAANLMPAIAEASLAGVPLVILTADRPPELQDLGAPQTLLQRGLFGTQVKWAADLPVPMADPALTAHAALTGRRAALTARRTPPGPVHLNVPLREPLMPDLESVGRSVGSMRRGGHAPTAPVVPVDLSHWARRLELRTKRGVVVAGATNLQAARVAITRLAEGLGWPLLADPLSNLRGGLGVISAYDAVLRHAPDWLKPEYVVRIGAPPTSKALNQFLKGIPTAIIDLEGWWRDPDTSGVELLSVASFGALSADDLPKGGQDHWRTRWRLVDEMASRTLSTALQVLADSQPGFEGLVFGQLPHGLFPVAVAGSSMPVRDLDSFWRGGDTVWVSNRGANGIDGVVSTGLGVARASTAKTLVVLGDLSFYHDMNGLLAGRLHAVDATLLILNNNGGGIFSFLPQHALPADQFERLFGTPHGLDFSAAAAVYGVPFVRTTTWHETREALTAPSSGLSIVEWQTLPREDNVAHHQELWRMVRRSVKEAEGALL